MALIQTFEANFVAGCHADGRPRGRLPGGPVETQFGVHFLQI